MSTDTSLGLALKHEVYGVLVDYCGAHNALSARRDFIASFPECREYRFMGSLGFGGKVWWNRGQLYVNCYPEHMTPEREVTIAATNKRLAALLAEHRVSGDEVDRAEPAEDLVLRLIDEELARLRRDDLSKCARWEWRQRAWQRGVSIARFIAAEHLETIRTAYHSHPSPSDPQPSEPTGNG